MWQHNVRLMNIMVDLYVPFSPRQSFSTCASMYISQMLINYMLSIFKCYNPKIKRLLFMWINNICHVITVENLHAYHLFYSTIISKKYLYNVITINITLLKCARWRARVTSNINARINLISLEPPSRCPPFFLASVTSCRYHI